MFYQSVVRLLVRLLFDYDRHFLFVQERTGGKIIRRLGGVVYLFRGRNYDHQKRPKLPVMLWKPATPVYPKLIQDAPEGLTKEAADSLRAKGKSLLPICKLGIFFPVSLMMHLLVMFLPRLMMGSSLGLRCIATSALTILNLKA